MASIYDQQESLQARSADFSLLLASLGRDNAEVTAVQVDFQALTTAWEHFCGTLSQQTEKCRGLNAQRLKDHRLDITQERAKQKQRRRHLQAKEIALDVQELELQKALERSVVLYQENLTNIELALQESKQTRIWKEAELKKQVEIEIEETFSGTDSVPKLILDGLKNPSACSLVPMSCESAVISNRSAFSYLTGDLSQRAPRPQVATKVKFQPRLKEEERSEARGSMEHSFNSESQAYVSLVDQLKSHEFKDCETESEGTATSEELRQVLEKAVEFNFDDPVRTKQDVLAQVKEARRLKDVPSAYNVSCS
jgi:hypothetical protein